jgi:hypothetical protein
MQRIVLLVAVILTLAAGYAYPQTSGGIMEGQKEETTEGEAEVTED